MKRFLWRLMLLALPLVFLAGLDLLLPADAFTFRAWEALQVSASMRHFPTMGILPSAWAKRVSLPGPFLPSVHLDRIEEGDLGHHSPYAIARRSIWETDAHGFRVRPLSEKARLVLVGDSQVVGNGCSQEDTLADVLWREHGIASYPYAPGDLGADLGRFFGDPRFVEQKPEFLVIERTERRALEEFQAVKPIRSAPEPFPSESLRWLAFALNRVANHNALSFLRARINGRPPPVVAGAQLFMSGDRAYAPITPESVRIAADTLARYVEMARVRGMRAVVMLVPEKETTYADLFREGQGPSVVRQLQKALQERGVAYIDLESDFVDARNAGRQPLLRDDGHWGPDGVRIAARKIAAWSAASPPLSLRQTE